MTTAPARFIDLHIVQSLPYSNVNRDDLGSPKTVTFGGTTRTRVSSQAWKRPTRLAVEAAIGERAVRTRRLPLQIQHDLVGRGWPEELAKTAGEQVIISTGELGLDKKTPMNSASLIFLPEPAAQRLADIAEEHREALEKALGGSAAEKKAAAKGVLPKDEVQKVLRSSNGSIALFGRMLAEIPGAGVDGSVQVAHAFTTHTTSVQADFFTAVDDEGRWAEDAGSGHMNTAEYSSGVFYRYATLDLRDLAANVDDPATARELTEAFLNSFITSMPSAKKNSTAPHTIPDLVHVAVRSDRPVSLAAAYEKPVTAGRDGWSSTSRDALAQYATIASQLLGTSGLLHRAWAGLDTAGADGLGERAGSFAELVTGAVAAATSKDKDTAA